LPLSFKKRGNVYSLSIVYSSEIPNTKLSSLRCISRNPIDGTNQIQSKKYPPKLLNQVNIIPSPHRLTRIKRYILFRNKRYPKDMDGAEIKRSELTRRHEQRIKTELSHSSFSM